MTVGRRMAAPFGRGGFFSSPAVAFGNVYAARDDGTVYAFDERTGTLFVVSGSGAGVQMIVNAGPH